MAAMSVAQAEALDDAPDIDWTQQNRLSVQQLAEGLDFRYLNPQSHPLTVSIRSMPWSGGAHGRPGAPTDLGWVEGCPRALR
ncbi:MAG TPA: hypothetical protein VGN26_22005 [Armatimonadota bacterium]